MNIFIYICAGLGIIGGIHWAVNVAYMLYRNHKDNKHNIDTRDTGAF